MKEETACMASGKHERKVFRLNRHMCRGT